MIHFVVPVIFMLVCNGLIFISYEYDRYSIYLNGNAFGKVSKEVTHFSSAHINES
jgi:hypothetical protein